MSSKILVVDDEPCIRRALQFQLERIGGMEVLTASEGEEAARLIEEERPCLVFLDVMLPKKNGYEICQWVKGRPDLSEIHVIILSARGQLSEVTRGMACGANEYMTKPFDPAEILKRARKILNQETTV